MERLTENKIVVVVRKTRLEELIVRFNTVSQARYYVEHMGADFVDYIEEDRIYHNALAEARAILSLLGRVHVVDRVFLPNFIFGDNDTVVAIGQDGLVANTLKYLTSQLLIGINPDPRRWDGILSPFQVKDLSTLIPDVFKKRRPIKEVTMAKATLSDSQSLYAVNDLFIGQKTHVSAKYEITSGSAKENQSSSGIIVSTGLGSTGWMKSIIAGATSIACSVSEKNTGIIKGRRFNWDADYLFFSVREPFPSKSSRAELVFGEVSKKKPLEILSQMPENGVIFSDGIESDFLEFNSGISATITVAEKKGLLVV